MLNFPHLPHLSPPWFFKWGISPVPHFPTSFSFRRKWVNVGGEDLRGQKAQQISPPLARGGEQ